MADIVNFPTHAGREAEQGHEPLMWVCECGCSSFKLLDDGTARCALCGTNASAGGGWYHEMNSDAKWEGDMPVREISASSKDESFAKRVIGRRLEDKDVVLAVVLKSGGTISTWTSVETDEQVQWCDRQLQRVADIITVGKPAPGNEETV